MNITAPLLFLLLLLASAYAQQMPTLPQKFIANFSASTGGQASTGQIWNDLPDRVRTDHVETAVDMATTELDFFSDGVMSSYSIQGGYCQANPPVAASPSGSFIPGANCTNPVFQSRVGSISSWTLRCTLAQGSINFPFSATFSFRDDTPVKISFSSFGQAAVINILSFSAVAPPTSVFVIPSICFSRSRQSAETFVHSLFGLHF